MSESFGPASESLEPWATNAATWDEFQGDAGSSWQRVIARSVERLLALRAGERVVEMCCGNGGLARRLARAGALVTASDGVPAMVDLARARSEDVAGRVAWRVADATLDATYDPASGPLGPGPFDAAVCSMAIMDLPDLAPLFRGVRRLVRAGGRFVVTSLHPCFMTHNGPLFEERCEATDGTVARSVGVKVARYGTPFRCTGIAIRGQPALQPYYHRPLGAILCDAFAAGWAMDGVEEPLLGADPGADRRLCWDSLTDVPPLIAIRLRAG